MANVKKSTPEKTPRKIKPALTPDARENLCISLAMDLVQQRLIDGTASSQETTHFLRLATSRARLEKEILEKQKELISAKTDALVAEKHRDELYKEAIAAMRKYSGHGASDDEDPDIY